MDPYGSRRNSWVQLTKEICGFGRSGGDGCGLRTAHAEQKAARFFFPVGVGKKRTKSRREMIYEMMKY